MDMDDVDVLAGAIVLAILVLVLVFVPVAVVWAFSVLLHVPFVLGFFEWLAGFVFVVLFGVRIFGRKE